MIHTDLLNKISQEHDKNMKDWRVQINKMDPENQQVHIKLMQDLEAASESKNPQSIQNVMDRIKLLMQK